MKGADHYVQAEQCMSDATFHADGKPDRPVHRDGSPMTLDERVFLMHRAQIHATLALAAAQALPTVEKYMGDSTAVTDWGHALSWLGTEEKPKRACEAVYDYQGGQWYCELREDHDGAHRFEKMPF